MELSLSVAVQELSDLILLLRVQPARSAFLIQFLHLLEFVVQQFHLSLILERKGMDRSNSRSSNGYSVNSRGWRTLFPLWQLCHLRFGYRSIFEAKADLSARRRELCRADRRWRR